ncbi:6-phosphofructokinase [Pedobacter antarcticus]|uniref:ATP-dependent 6-phosphofructokinase n=2 Tax=Pedobacter antarcticus TaxID=34086 RepID=A0A081PH90_9SPHI|nr:6-phosphofructokinase [Pedobacter antarcticus]KEQ30063.1 6-phosphofructokinase [Pedobacter antarcticus 4BY]SDM68805.1 6-phosphofructokinase [Pedobacter antarcticus]SFF39514.1 6-phosphofructokinase [Pedobacter antarcticus]
MRPNIKNIAVLTSGGDAPGMNACIRAVVRTGIYNGINMFGVLQGYQGLINNNIIPMDARSVSNIIHLGGTVLKTARCLEFKTDEGMDQAYANMKAHNIDALVVIGGDGTFTGARRFSERHPVSVIGIPGTIDNDLYGSDFTLGYDTAINTVIEAIDKIRDTADSHDRLFFVEVMGRDSGCIALRSAIACGAEAVLLPEKATSLEELIRTLEIGAATKKSSSIVIVSEGHKQGGAYDIAKHVKERFNHYDTKVTILGHLQRGGSPSSFDRILGSRLGYAAVNELLKGSSRQMVGLRGNDIQLTSLDEALTAHSFKLESDLLEMTKVLSI